MLAIFSILILSYVLVTRVNGDGSQIVACALAAVATGLFIFSLPGSALDVQKFFGVRALQAIGNSSYSIYLWHWIGVSISIDLLRPNSSVDKSVMVVASLVPAVLSYKFVEQPFRKMRSERTSKKIVAALLLISIPALMLFGLDIAKDRTREQYGNVYSGTLLDGCDFLNDVCIVGKDNASQKILLYGDSHIYQLIPIFVEYVEKHDVQITTCALNCNGNNFASIKDGSFSPGDFDLVINSFKTNSEELSRETRKDLAISFAAFARARNAAHLIVLDNPFYAESVAPRRIRKPELLPLPRGPQDEVANQITADWKEDLGEEVFFYDPFAVLCNEVECPLTNNGKVLYLDNNHLSMVGVRLIEPSLIAMVDDILGK